MREPALTDHVVRVDGRINVGLVDTDGDTHDHVLGTLNSLVVHLEQVALLERFEAEVVIVEITFVINGSVEAFIISLNNLVDVISDQTSICSVILIVVQSVNHFFEARSGLLV